MEVSRVRSDWRHAHACMEACCQSLMASNANEKREAFRVCLWKWQSRKAGGYERDVDLAGFIVRLPKGRAGDR